MPTKRPELVMTEWARYVPGISGVSLRNQNTKGFNSKYAPLVHVKVGMQHHIIINDTQIGKDLLEKK